MNLNVILFIVALVLIMLGLPLLFLQAQYLSRNYGPSEPIVGPPCLEGTLTCVAWKVPTIGKTPEFLYHVNGRFQGSDFSGGYSKTSAKADKDQIFLRYTNQQVRGHSSTSRIFVVEGTLTPREANLLTGSPRGSFLGLGKPYSPLKFRIHNDQVKFAKPTRGADLGGNSHLTLNDTTITGRIEHPRELWFVTVKVTYRNIPPQLAVLAIALMASNLISFHYD